MSMLAYAYKYFHQLRKAYFYHNFICIQKIHQWENSLKVLNYSIHANFQILQNNKIYIFAELFQDTDVIDDELLVNIDEGTHDKLI